MLDVSLKTIVVSLMIGVLVFSVVSVLIEEALEVKPEYTLLEVVDFPIEDSEATVKVYRFIKDKTTTEVEVYTEKGVFNMEKYLEERE